MQAAGAPSLPFTNTAGIDRPTKVFRPKASTLVFLIPGDVQNRPSEKENFNSCHLFFKQEPPLSGHETIESSPPALATIVHFRRQAFTATETGQIKRLENE